MLPKHDANSLSAFLLLGNEGNSWKDVINMDISW
jgi:hypothetical protein